LKIKIFKGVDMQLCIFEDTGIKKFEPLSLSRPVYDLACGYSTLRNKILKIFPGINYSLHCRSYLEQVVRLQNPGIEVNKIIDDDCLFINGRVLADANLPRLFSIKKKEQKLFVKNGTMVGIRVSGERLSRINFNSLLDYSDFEGIPVEEVDVKTVDYIWDLIKNNGSELRNDFGRIADKRKKKNQKKITGKVHEGVHLLGKKEIIIEKGAEVKPGTVLDASGGPIYIDKNALIFPNAVIEGPVYIGESSRIKSGATIYKNVSIGKVCKVGGEVEASVILPYTNKQHSGFLGHAYLGSWVNIGADTNNSDLKNNYGTIKMYINGEFVDTGTQFLGLLMGDHSKTAINTMFNTGTVVGFSCNIFGSGFPDKFIPSFSWGGAGSISMYKVEKGIEVARKVMLRRDIIMSEEEEKLFHQIFEITESERLKEPAIGKYNSV
jgi:UDP-N-acetylglucosamine diphosphorylase/glucosamine-1-phosphate N-acetyltransferase